MTSSVVVVGFLDVALWFYSSPYSPHHADHTLGNMLRDIMWQHPYVQLASYTKEHPTSTEVLVRCQTSAEVSAEQGVVEALHIGKAMLSVAEEGMSAAVETWRQQQELSVQ